MKRTKFFTLLPVVFAFLSYTSFGQARVKAGIGINYITNEFESPHLYDYAAPSLHISYAFIKKTNFNISLESNLSLKNKIKENEEKFGLTSSLPLIAQFNLKKLNISAGAGPGYFKQTYKGYYKEGVSQFYLTSVVGAGFSGNSLSGNVLRPEYNLRFSYFKYTQNSKLDAGLVSFIIFIKA